MSGGIRQRPRSERPSFPPPSQRIQCAASALFVAMNCSMAFAQTEEPQRSTDASTADQISGELPEISVVSERTPAARVLPPGESTTIIESKELQRYESATIFEAVKDVPGVSVDGGPRATGMKFNIRGFRGNEDVLFKIDGAFKGFEKYRFGSGVFIEPELIRSITVERGPSVLAGSGAIGGAVIATTKSAADFLGPGERYGGLLKLGYDNNSREALWMATAYGRPTERSDLLVSFTRRNSDDIRLAGGEHFPATANSTQASLIKFAMFPTDELMLELSRTAFESGPTFTPFDANSSTAFVGGYVHQQVDDETINLRFVYQPADSWLRLRGLLAREITDLQNLMKPGESTFATPCTTTPCDWDPPSPSLPPTGDINDMWDYEIWTAEIFNDTTYRLGPVQGTLTVGAQAVRNRRDLRRLTENPYMNLPDGRYPLGFDTQQPPGTKIDYALIAQNPLTWSGVTLTPGIRFDYYRLEADGQTAINRAEAGVATEYWFTEPTPSVLLMWRPGETPLYLSYRWASAFKPPLITDYFGMGAASPCAGFLTPDDQQIAPQGCGDMLDPTRSRSNEYTIGWSQLQAGPEGRASTEARLTYYEIDTTGLVGPSYLDAVDGVIVQPYYEHRRGVELEAVHDAGRWFGMFNFSWIEADRTNKLNGETHEFTAGIPGKTTGVTLGYRPIPDRLEMGWRLIYTGEQLLLPGATSLTASTAYCGKVVPAGVAQQATTLQYLFANWKINRHFTANLAINNLFDKPWCNNGDELGNVIGLPGPGRSIRISLTAQL